MKHTLTRRGFLAQTTASGLGLGFAGACAQGRAGKWFGAPSAPPRTWRAGVAKEKITPTRPVWMTGYGARNKPSEGVLCDLYVRVLALEDETGARAVLVASDILGFPPPVNRSLSDKIEKKYRVPRARLLLASSHTHGGPALHDPLGPLYGPRVTAEQWSEIQKYTQELEDKVVATVGRALTDLQPAKLAFGRGQAKFGINRREKTKEGTFRIGVNPNGPVDPDVPVLRIESASGGLRAVVFGYACHTTTLGGNIYQFHGDYAGFAQEALEKEHPGATALFVMGCGGDINPHPRGTLEQAQEYGRQLAAAVNQAMSKPMRALRGPLKPAYARVDIPFAPHPPREAWEKQLQDADIYKQWQAKEMLKQLERDGRLPASYPYPIQMWQFGDNHLTMIVLAGEVVVDYALRLKRELGAGRTWVAGYCNEVFAYIPSRRIVEEGGYEGGGAMVYYVQPGPFAPQVEEVIIGKVHAMVKQLQSDRSDKSDNL
ncbi:MAG: neutral/alkaline non-lysosomal ceramidase N-terminal domain-containing protein [Candidatus Sumerlaeia bacterium]|nr:neutral/alkaline non-lysosomal ceramidase N-terminal domain-containing protein [Candidatus Sumerlaeia bacterium]